MKPITTLYSSLSAAQHAAGKIRGRLHIEIVAVGRKYAVRISL